MRQETQAILLAAGPGSRMMPLVGKRPKCLLPIGNFPMICYSLCLLQEAGFSEVTVIVSNAHKQDILKLAEQFELKMRLDFATIKPEDSPGTLDALRSIGNKIKKNVDEVLVISSDLITDMNLNSIMDEHLSKGAAVTLLTAKQNAAYCQSQPPGPKSKPPIGSDIICCEEKSQRLLFAIAGGDYEDVVNLPSHIVSIAGKGGIDFSTSSQFLDAHLYVMKRWVVEKILSPTSPCASMDSLKAEVIPHLITEQFSPNKNQRVVPLSKYDQQMKKYDDYIKKFNTSTIDSRFHPLSKLDQNVCYAHCYPGLCLRVNTLNTYWHINKEIYKLFDKLKVPKDSVLRNSSTEINKKAQICEDTLIARGTIISEKTNISSCVIGNHCRVKPLVRITNSLLFDYVTIEERCVIENSIVCTSIDKPCRITNSIVVDTSKIVANGVYMNEILEENQDFTD